MQKKSSGKRRLCTPIWICTMRMGLNVPYAVKYLLVNILYSNILTYTLVICSVVMYAVDNLAEEIIWKSIWTCILVEKLSHASTKMFLLRGSLNFHMNKHGNNRFLCILSSKGALKQHMKNLHNTSYNLLDFPTMHEYMFFLLLSYMQIDFLSLVVVFTPPSIRTLCGHPFWASNFFFILVCFILTLSDIFWPPVLPE